MHLEIDKLKECVPILEAKLVKMEDDNKVGSLLESKVAEYEELLEADNAYDQAYDNIGIEANAQ